MKAILRTWDRDISFEDSEIEVADGYDFGLGPYAEANERLCPVVGSNQQILELLPRRFAFSATTTDLQRDELVISLRKAGYSAYRETDVLHTNATRGIIELVWDDALVIE